MTQPEKSTDAKNELTELREKIDAIDEQVVSLLARRKDQVDKIVAYKKRCRLPVFHSAREEDLISQRRIQGKNKGLDPDFIEDIFRCIIRQSRKNQTLHMTKQSIRPGEKVLIVGGMGKMGKFFCNRFSEGGYEVRILDKNDWDRAEALCRDIALVIISVPIDITSKTIQRLSPFLTEKTVLCDITSVKDLPLTSMLDAHKGPVLGLHPLFGESTSTMDKQIVVVTPGRDHDAYKWLLDQFEVWGCILLTSDAKEHDQIMDFVQGLRHFATFAFGRFLWKKGVSIKKSLEFSSPIYRLELGMVGRLFAQDSSLYSEIIFSTQERRYLLAEFIQSFQESLEMLEKDDRQCFINEFEKVSGWFGPFSEQALRESSFLIDKLVERF